MLKKCRSLKVHNLEVIIISNLILKWVDFPFEIPASNTSWGLDLLRFLWFSSVPPAESWDILKQLRTTSSNINPYSPTSSNTAFDNTQPQELIYYCKTTSHKNGGLWISFQTKATLFLLHYWNWHAECCLR
jgi:hypothetical protein